MRGIEADGERIAKLRVTLRLTQEELAANSQCDVKTIRNAERGRRLDLATLRRIAAALNVPAALIVRSGDSSEPEAERRLEVVHQWVRAFTARDIDAMLAVYHEHAVLAYPGEPMPGAGTFRGKAELRQQAQLTFATFDTEPITPNMYRLHAVDNYVFLRSTRPTSATVRQTGARFTSAVVHEFEFEGDKIARHQGFYDTSAMEKAGWGEDETE